MEKIILIRYGEIFLKGQNRSYFEKALVKNIKKALEPFGRPRVFIAQSRIYVEGIEISRIIIEALSRVFGIIGINPARKISKDYDIIKSTVESLMEEAIKNSDKDNKTFKIESRRGDKTFPMGSMDLNRELGAFVLDKFPDIRVDVHNPDILVNIEIREDVYIYYENYPGAGGMPVGTNGKAALLLSGGIDSPAAGWMIAKRGVELVAVHYHSFPYTSHQAKEKVIELCRLLTKFSGPVKLYVVSFTEIQQELYKKCPDGLLTILMRRYMMRIGEIIANKERAKALITGESIGQVASQTMEGLVATDDAVRLPVFRPFIGFDKNEIVEIAKRIDTYETSILPYEDCCTVFVPKHPITRPNLNKVREAETLIDGEGLVKKALEDMEIHIISPEGHFIKS